MENYHESVAVLIARVFLAVLFIIQGYDKIFRIKLQNVSNAFKYEVKFPGLPDFVYSLIAFLSSYAEFIGGIMLLFGFMKYYVMTALGIDLLIVTTAMTLIKPVWNVDLVFPRLVLLIFLMVIPASWDLISLDHLISINK